MLFVILFSLGALAVPLVIDIGKHGADNILRRSGRDVLSYPPVQNALTKLHVATGRVSTITASVTSFAALAVVAYIAIKGISFISHAVIALTR
jgi:hypothetical protein